MLLLRKGLSLHGRPVLSRTRTCRRGSPQWDSGMAMVSLNTRESGDAWTLFLVCDGPICVAIFDFLCPIICGEDTVA